jgi:hypothetical protein
MYGIHLQSFLVCLCFSLFVVLATYIDADPPSTLFAVKMAIELFVENLE